MATRLPVLAPPSVFCHCLQSNLSKITMTDGKREHGWRDRERERQRVGTASLLLFLSKYVLYNCLPTIIRQGQNNEGKQAAENKVWLINSDSGSHTHSYFTVVMHETNNYMSIKIK